MAPVTLIYCAGGNRRYVAIAQAAGLRYGAQLPDTIYGSLYFADQDWKKPDRAAYMAALAKHRPIMATVLDWEQPEQRGEVLDWAEEAAQYMERVLIIPKCDVIGSIPRRIGGADVVLAYSVPTQYGGCPLLPIQFAGWPIHLLGGSPKTQYHLYQHMSAYADVVSADGNYLSMKANRFCQFFDGRRWHQLRAKGFDGPDAPYEAFRRSCDGMIKLWSK